MGPGGLHAVMCDIKPSRDVRRMVGYDLSDDAGVYLLDDNTTLVQTVDVITPVVDDPFTFGRIAAANALSDIYAMGARPLTALNIAAFPDRALPLTILTQILKGGLDACEEASCALMGGHTLRDDEIKYGLSVTGVARPDEIVSNAGAKPGDVLVLTKPIGVGLITTAIKRDSASGKMAESAIASMSTLNKSAAEAMAQIEAHACTDITGFGLIGHAAQLAKASKVTLEIDSAKVPLLPGVKALATKGFAPGGTRNNIAAFADSIKLPRGFEPAMQDVLFDPQTSGGLLIAVAGKDAKKLVKLLKSKRTPAAAIIGSVGKKQKGIDIVIS